MSHIDLECVERSYELLDVAMNNYSVQTRCNHTHARAERERDRQTDRQTESLSCHWFFQQCRCPKITMHIGAYRLSSDCKLFRRNFYVVMKTWRSDELVIMKKRWADIAQNRRGRRWHVWRMRLTKRRGQCRVCSSDRRTRLANWAICDNEPGSNCLQARSACSTSSSTRH